MSAGFISHCRSRAIIEEGVVVLVLNDCNSGPEHGRLRACLYQKVYALYDVTEAPSPAIDIAGVMLQMDNIRQGVHGVVAIPGRLKGLLNKQRLNQEICKYMCLDKAACMEDASGY